MQLCTRPRRHLDSEFSMFPLDTDPSFSLEYSTLKHSAFQLASDYETSKPAQHCTDLSNAAMETWEPPNYEPSIPGQHGTKKPLG